MANLSNINLNRLAVFVAVIETGSITAAAKRLGLAKTMVSTHMQRLETEIGANLLVRTTRRLHLTEAGSAFYEACQKILHDTELAISQASSNTRELRGMLRVAATVDFGATVVAPLAAELCRANPELRIEIVASDNRVDMVAAGIDVSIRVGRLADSSHKAALIAHFEEWVLATPDFIADRIPQTPEQYRSYAIGWIRTSVTSKEIAARWREEEDLRVQCGVSDAELIDIEAVKSNRYKIIKEQEALAQSAVNE